MSSAALTIARAVGLGATMHKQLNIAIICQNEIEREGLRRILSEQSFNIIGTHRDHRGLDLDTVIADPNIVAMAIIDGSTEEESLASCQFIQARWPECKIVIFAANCQGKRVADAFQAGIDGYVGKHTSCESLAEMLKLIALGEKMIPSQILFDLALKSDNFGDSTIACDEANLSDREVEILQGLIRGEPNKVISRRLDITEATVKVHVKSILRKIGVVNRTQAAIWGMTRGLTEVREAATDLAPNVDAIVDRAAEVHACYSN